MLERLGGLSTFRTKPAPASVQRTRALGIARLRNLVDFYEQIAGIPLGGDLDYSAVFVNYLKEIPIGCLTAYLGAGVGYASVEGNPAGFSYSDSAWAYQLIAGLDVPICDNVDLFVQ